MVCSQSDFVHVSKQGTRPISWKSCDFGKTTQLLLSFSTCVEDRTSYPPLEELWLSHPMGSKRSCHFAALSPIVGSDMGWPVSVPHLSRAVIHLGMELYKCQGFSWLFFLPSPHLPFLSFPPQLMKIPSFLLLRQEILESFCRFGVIVCQFTYNPSKGHVGFISKYVLNRFTTSVLVEPPSSLPGLLQSSPCFDSWPLQSVLNTAPE